MANDGNENGVSLVESLQNSMAPNRTRAVIAVELRSFPTASLCVAEATAQERRGQADEIDVNSPRSPSANCTPQYAILPVAS